MQLPAIEITGPGVQQFKIEALLVFVLLSTTYGYFFHDPRWNGNSRLGLTFALVQEGRLTIDSFYQSEGLETGSDKAFYNGHYYTDKAIGTSVVAAIIYLPLYAFTRLIHVDLNLPLVKYILTFFVIGLPSAIAGSLVYVLCRFISGDRVRSYIVTVALTLGTMSFPFSVIFFGHQFAGALLFCAFFMIFWLKVRPRLWKTGYLFSLGFLLGLSLITEYTTAGIVFALVVYYFYLVWTERSQRYITSVAFPALGGLIPVVIMSIYNILCFGEPMALGYENLTDPHYRVQMAQGIAGIGWPKLQILYYLTIHPALGLFWQSPVLLMALVGGYFMYTCPRYRIEAVIATFAFGFYLVINSGYFEWWGAYSFGPRHMTPMILFLCLPLIFIPKRFTSILTALGLISALQMFIVVASNILAPHDMISNINKLGFFDYSTIWNYCLKQLLGGNFAWNLGTYLFGLTNSLSVVPIVAAELGITIIFFAMDPAHARSTNQRPYNIAQAQ